VDDESTFTRHATLGISTGCYAAPVECARHERAGMHPFPLSTHPEPVENEHRREQSMPKTSTSMPLPHPGAVAGVSLTFTSRKP